MRTSRRRGWRLPFRRSSDTSVAQTPVISVSSETAVQVPEPPRCDPVYLPSSSAMPPEEREISSECFSSAISSSLSSSESSTGTAIGFLPETPKASSAFSAVMDELEEEILSKLVYSEPSEMEAAMASLRLATGENKDRRLALCTPRLLAAVREMMASQHAAVQINAVAALVNLSLESPNKVPIVRCGTVPALVEVLKGSGHVEAREQAAGAAFSLAMEETNRAAISALGVIPPLLRIFAGGYDPLARRDAGMALYYLSLAAASRSKITRSPGALKALLTVAVGGSSELERVAMMVICNLAGSNEGRAALIDAGAVAVMVARMREGGGDAAEMDRCVVALYGMSRAGRRFRGPAVAARTEEVLARMLEANGGGMRDEMGKKILRSIKFEEDEEADAYASVALGDIFSDVDDFISEGLLSFRQRALQPPAGCRPAAGQNHSFS